MVAGFHPLWLPTERTHRLSLSKLLPVREQLKFWEVMRCPLTPEQK